MSVLKNILKEEIQMLEKQIEWNNAPNKLYCLWQEKNDFVKNKELKNFNPIQDGYSRGCSPMQGVGSGRGKKDRRP